MDTADICCNGKVISGAVSVEEAARERGVYYFKSSAPSAALVVTTDAVLYVNDGVIEDWHSGLTGGTCYKTDLPVPNSITR